MKARIQQYDGYNAIWSVQTWRWWCPLWITVGRIYGGEEAVMEQAQRMVYPKTIEVRKI